MIPALTNDQNDGDEQEGPIDVITRIRAQGGGLARTVRTTMLLRPLLRATDQHHAFRVDPRESLLRRIGSGCVGPYKRPYTTASRLPLRTTAEFYGRKQSGTGPKSLSGKKSGIPSAQ